MVVHDVHVFASFCVGIDQCGKGSNGCLFERLEESSHWYQAEADACNFEKWPEAVHRLESHGKSESQCVCVSVSCLSIIDGLCTPAIPRGERL